MTNVQQEVEQWKDVPGFEGLYLVSDLGRVISLPKRGRKEFFVKLATRKGYPFFGFCRDKKYTHIFIHRLVMRVFKGEPTIEKPCVLHIDDNPSNCRLSNLKYGSHYDNMMDAFNKGRIKAPIALKGSENGNASKVRQYTLAGDYIKTFGSVSDANRELCLGRTSITQAIRQQRPVAGFLWTYDKPNAKAVLREVRKIAKVYQFDMNGKIIHEFASAMEAAKVLCMPERTIRTAAAENRQTANGYRLSFCKVMNIRDTMQHNSFPSKPVLQLDKNNNIIREFDSIQYAAKSINKSPGFVGSVCRGVKKTAGGYIWRFKEAS